MLTPAKASCFCSSSKGVHPAFGRVIILESLHLSRAYSAIIPPIAFANTSPQNASYVGSYIGLYWVYAPGILGNKFPESKAVTPV